MQCFCNRIDVRSMCTCKHCSEKQFSNVTKQLNTFIFKRSGHRKPTFQFWVDVGRVVHPPSYLLVTQPLLPESKLHSFDILLLISIYLSRLVLFQDRFRIKKAMVMCVSEMSAHILYPNDNFITTALFLSAAISLGKHQAERHL